MVPDPLQDPSTLELVPSELLVAELLSRCDIGIFFSYANRIRGTGRGDTVCMFRGSSDEWPTFHQYMANFMEPHLDKLPEGSRFDDAMNFLPDSLPDSIE